MRTIVLANQKGGVGKTTTAINLGTALAAMGEVVLLIDLDPQGNASTGLGIDSKKRTSSTYEVLLEQKKLSSIIQSTGVPNLFLAPSTLDLLGVELHIASHKNRVYKIRQALIEMKEKHTTCFSYVLIDCPPSLNLLTLNALAAANSVLIPLQCEFFALEGLSQLLSTVQQVKKTLNPSLIVHGILLTMFDSRNNLAAQVVEDVRKIMGTKVYDTIIPRNVRISEAPSYGKPVLIYDVKCIGSQAYLRLASEVLRREKKVYALSSD